MQPEAAHLDEQQRVGCAQRAQRALKVVALDLEARQAAEVPYPRGQVRQSCGARDNDELRVAYLLFGWELKARVGAGPTVLQDKGRR